MLSMRRYNWYGNGCEIGKMVTAQAKTGNTNKDTRYPVLVLSIFSRANRLTSSVTHSRSYGIHYNK
jgi:hypothetical protein